MAIALYRHTYRPAALFDRFDRDIADFFKRGDQAPASSNARWAPPVDVTERANDFLIELDVPGIDPAAIQITLDDGVLKISGERVAAHDEGQQPQRRERRHGTFERRFTLPDSADDAQISADSHFGVLRITVAKQPQREARRIAVQASAPASAPDSPPDSDTD